MLHVVGWEQHFNPREYAIAEDLTTSESGLYFQQIHPLLTLDNLRSIAPNFDNASFDAYLSSTTYLPGMLVSYEGNMYKAVQRSQGQTPAENPEYWQKTDTFSNWLEGKTKASIQKAILRFCTEKALTGAYKNLFENRVLFMNSGRIVDTIPNNNHLVGFEVVPIRSKGVTTKIEKIGLQFTKPGRYTIYIVHSSSAEPVYTLELDKTKADSMEWFKLDNVLLPFMSESSDAGGSWFICYDQSALPADSFAIRKNKDWAKGPCPGCSRAEYDLWLAWSQYLEVHPFRVSNLEVPYDSTDLITSTPNLWDISKNDYTYDTNYGLNLELTVACDITDFIVEQRHIFSDVIALQVVCDMLREFAYNPNVRTNRNSINASRSDILTLLDGDDSAFRKSGLSVRLDEAFKALDLSTRGIDRVCLPCANHGVKYRTV